MSQFHKFAALVHARYSEMVKHELFVVGDDNRAFEAVYLAAFPPGTNPVYKTNTEHDCSCCKNFIRNLGNVVAIVNGKIQTVWDIEGAPAPYDTVAQAMANYVRSLRISGLFRTKETSYGAAETKQALEDGTVKRWNHFHGKVEKGHHHHSPDSAIGDYNSRKHVFFRGLNEIKPEALETISDLIASKALYRGEEHQRSVNAFRALQAKFLQLDLYNQHILVWSMASEPAAVFRNTVIGTLAVDLSEGVDLEQAVRSFESKVAPTNYKRPTALITPNMVKDAMKTITDLGLDDALQRRFARISDVSVNNVLWVNNSTKAQMRSGLETLLLDAAVTKPPKKLNSTDISIDDFMSSVLPTASSIEMLVQNTHLNNFVSLTAPVHADSGQLFKWSNDFGWSYDGNITDSIKEKVKAAGGNVTNALLRVSLAWFNYDDLDIHVREPNGTLINFVNKAGKLDVDMNAGGGSSRTPVENVSWRTLQDGPYKVIVNQYCQRETSDVGCTIEIESAGKITQLSHPKALKGATEFCTIHIKGGLIEKLDIAKGIVGSGIAQEKWGIKTESFVPVTTLMLSPNHWDNNTVGNKHWFFMLQGCLNPDPTRGIYNEFLNSNLEKHRKVFEILGDKTKCQPSEQQLSGLGFSSTRNDTVTLRVSGDKGVQTFNVTF